MLHYDVVFSPKMLQLNDYRAEFSRWWSKEMRAVKFPSQGTVFDYFIDSETKKFIPWSEKMEQFELEPDVPLQVRIRVGCVHHVSPNLVNNPFESRHVLCVSDCFGSHSRNHLSDLLHGPAAPERKAYYVGGQRWCGQDHPGV